MKLDDAIRFVRKNAWEHREHQPTLGTLLEEMGELARALEGKHEHPPVLELMQIAGIAINMMRLYDKRDLVRAIMLRDQREESYYRF